MKRHHLLLQILGYNPNTGATNTFSHQNLLDLWRSHFQEDRKQLEKFILRHPTRDLFQDEQGSNITKCLDVLIEEAKHREKIAQAPKPAATLNLRAKGAAATPEQHLSEQQHLSRQQQQRLTTSESAAALGRAHGSPMSEQPLSNAVLIRTADPDPPSELPAAPSEVMIHNQRFGVRVNSQVRFDLNDPSDKIWKNPATAFHGMMSPQVIGRWGIIIKLPQYKKLLDMYYEILRPPNVQPTKKIRHAMEFISSIVELARLRILDEELEHGTLSEPLQCPHDMP